MADAKDVVSGDSVYVLRIDRPETKTETNNEQSIIGYTTKIYYSNDIANLVCHIFNNWTVIDDCPIELLKLDFMQYSPGLFAADNFTSYLNGNDVAVFLSAEKNIKTNHIIQIYEVGQKFTNIDNLPKLSFDHHLGFCQKDKTLFYSTDPSQLSSIECLKCVKKIEPIDPNLYQIEDDSDDDVDE